ncbi:MAG: hydantoinase/oxoprolinase family protein [Bacillota bacterium]
MTDILLPTAWRAAVDTGGTFTGACMILDKSGRVFSVKVPSTPEDPSSAIMHALACLCKLSGAGMDYLSMVTLGTTVAANTIAQNTGAGTALLVTRGFRDVLHIGRQARPHAYRLADRKTPPMVPRRYVFEISERVLPGGHVHIPLNEDEVAGFIVPRLQESGIQSIAVCFLHSYENPLHEQRVRDIITDLIPGIPVTISSEIYPFPGEYERAAAAVLNAALTPVAGSYIEKLASRLRSGSNNTPGIWIFQSDGGVMNASQAAKESIRTVLSGPAGGVAACAQLARRTGRPNIVALDMGGTSTYFSIIHKDRPGIKSSGFISGQPLAIPMLDINTIGTGGGSIARAENGFLNVGPVSAGISPGPACFARGGTLPTCTDANLILGRVSPESFTRAGIKPEIAPAVEAVEKYVSNPMGIPVRDAAEGIIKVANSNIVRAIRKIFTGTGYDPKDFTLVSFGGAGPAHAAEIAQELGIPNVLIPFYSGVYSALGMLFADLRRDYRHSFISPLAQTNPEIIDNEFRLLEKKAREEFSSGGISWQVVVLRSADIRYTGQSHVINMQVPSGRLTPADLKLLGRAFGVEYESRFGYSPEKLEAEITDLRLTAMAYAYEDEKNSSNSFYNVLTDRNSFDTHSQGKTRSVVFGGKEFDTPVYDSNGLSPHSFLKGPAIISLDYSTAVVCPGMSASVDAHGNIIINTVVK